MLCFIQMDVNFSDVSECLLAQVLSLLLLRYREKAVKVLEQLSGQIKVFSKARYTNRSFGIKRNEKLAVNCTVHGAKVEEISRTFRHNLDFFCLGK